VGIILSPKEKPNLKLILIFG